VLPLLVVVGVARTPAAPEAAAQLLSEGPSLALTVLLPPPLLMADVWALLAAAAALPAAGTRAQLMLAGVTLIGHAAAPA
jgi:hypothetical protein